MLFIFFLLLFFLIFLYAQYLLCSSPSQAHYLVSEAYQKCILMIIGDFIVTYVCIIPYDVLTYTNHC